MILVLSVPNAFSQSNSIDREHDAIIVTGEMLAPFAEAPIGDLFLYAFDSQSKIFTQIPFQFDERDTSGSFFIADQVAGLDSNDQLVFMASDLGDRDGANPPIAPGNWLSDAISMTNPRVEISITDVLSSSTLSKNQGLAQGWTYLFRSSSLTKEFSEDYVVYTAPTSGGDDTITGQTYTLGGNAKGFFGSLFLPNSPSTDLIDSERIRISIFTENSFTFQGIALRDGPVRVIRDLKLDLLGTAITLPVQYFKSFVSQSANIDLTDPPIQINQLRHSIALSTNANGMKFTNSNNTDVSIDGQPDTVNDQIENSPEFNYTHVTGNQGTIIQLFTIPGNVGTSQSLHYDDQSGSIGDIGLVVDDDDGITVQVPLILKLILSSPNQPSSLGDQLANFEENPLMVDTLSQTFNQVVPVELGSFTASVEKSNIRLTWITASETNNFGFDIERSSQVSEDWQKIAFVEGKGTTTAPVRYEYKDEGLPAGAYRYRLKQIDTDGSFEYSQVIRAKVGLIEKFALQQNFPNPFNPTTIIHYQIPETPENSSARYQTRLTIYNLLGVEVRKLVAEEKPPGVYSVLWNGKNNGGLEVPSGVYVYRLQAGRFTDTKKMLLVR